MSVCILNSARAEILIDSEVWAEIYKRYGGSVLHRD